jgi:hypothetical protein
VPPYHLLDQEVLDRVPRVFLCSLSSHNLPSGTFYVGIRGPNRFLVSITVGVAIRCPAFTRDKPEVHCHHGRTLDGRLFDQLPESRRDRSATSHWRLG